MQNLEQQQQVLDRIQAELNAWYFDFDLRELAKNFQFQFDAVRFFGVHWEPSEFLEKAREVGHPLSPGLALPAELAQCIDSCATGGALLISKKRLEFFRFWNKRAREFQDEEVQLRTNMDPGVEKVVKGKKLVLFKDMLKHYNYPDSGVLDELVNGASLIGDVDTTNIAVQVYACFAHT